MLDNIIVLKCGGSSIDELSDSFFDNVQSLINQGVHPVIVHGGGPAIQSMLEKLNLQFEFIDGLRKTTDEMMDVVEMVLTGSVNPTLSRRLNDHSINAVGISGADMNVLEATPLDYDKYGLVGEVSNVNVEVLHDLMSKNIVPVISPIAYGKDGNKYNINADTAAGAVAAALNAKQLIFVTDVPGILQDGELLEEVTTETVEKLIQNNTIFGGMIPKVKAAMKGLKHNVSEVMIVNGKKSKMKNKNTLAGTTIKNTKIAVVTA